ncbi:SOS response-associated protein YedK [Anaerolineae bacterium]|nr:SOS response-associated protein YedK [Anaerolineae bacterium]
MCGRYAISLDPDQLATHFHAEPSETPLRARLNAAPSEYLPVLLNSGERRISLLRWGLIPSWAKDPTIANNLINARAETIEEKPSFRDAFKKRRCLVLVDAFYEWQSLPNGKKQPMKIALQSGEPFAFAGLWEQWQPPAGEPLRTFTIITTSANPLIESIHQRMPVMLTPKGEQMWLDNQASVEVWRNLLLPFEADLMKIEPVTSDILRQSEM